MVKIFMFCLKTTNNNPFIQFMKTTIPKHTVSPMKCLLSRKLQKMILPKAAKPKTLKPTPKAISLPSQKSLKISLSKNTNTLVRPLESTLSYQY